MKRYVVDGNVIDTRNIVGFANERLFIELPDLHAWALKHKATVEGMKHGPRCGPGWLNRDTQEEANHCPRCVALREIEELL
jgi:hypothetical protein